MMLLKSAHVSQFLAIIGMAMYAVSGTPTNSTVIADFAGSTGEVKLGLQHRARVQYTAYAIRRGEVLNLGELLETNGDRPYSFQPVQSTMALSPESKGFESSVVGMSEDSRRAVVVPSTLQRAGRHPFGTDNVVFVVQLVRLMHVDSPTDAAASVPTVLSTYDNALVPVSGGLAVYPPPLAHGGGGAGPINILRIENNSPQGVMDYGAGGHIAVPSSTVGTGIPAEHMTTIQKVGATINSATSTARDIYDATVSLAGEWKLYVDRPKPSVLTNVTLEQSIKQLIMDNERVKDELQRRDELIRVIDQRNRELQKRVDSAAILAQQLMDEKNSEVSKSSDSSLEKERAIMKIQEQINHSSSERDDIQRHLKTVKRLLEVSDDELREIRSKIDVHSIQAQSTAAKLDATQDTLAEERARRKGLEAKMASILEEISNCQADVHLKNALLEDLRRKADSERTHQSQIMEDERQRRLFEAQQLRSDIIEELQLREQIFLSDRARVSDDNFKRGQAEGKEIGRREARIDVETQIEGLRLESQRAHTELSAYKTELRTLTEEAMATNRKLESEVSALKRTLDEATRAKVQKDFQREVLRSRVRCVEDRILLAITSITHRLTRPIQPDDLIGLVEALRCCKALDFTFQDEQRKNEIAEAHARRIEWIKECVNEQYDELVAQTYQEWEGPLLAAHEATVATVRHLWTERDGAANYDLISAEMKLRFAISQEADKFFDDVTAMYAIQMEERGALSAEAEQMTEKLFTMFLQFHDDVNAFIQEQASVRMALKEEAGEAQKKLEAEETGAFAELLREHELVVFREVIEQQNGVFVEEEGCRATNAADEAEAFDSLTFTEKADLEAVRVRIKNLEEIAMFESAVSLVREKVIEEEAANLEDIAGLMRTTRPLSPLRRTDSTEKLPEAQEHNEQEVDGHGSSKEAQWKAVDGISSNECGKGDGCDYAAANAVCTALPVVHTTPFAAATLACRAKHSGSDSNEFRNVEREEEGKDGPLAASFPQEVQATAPYPTGAGNGSVVTHSEEDGAKGRNGNGTITVKNQAAFKEHSSSSSDDGTTPMQPPQRRAPISASAKAKSAVPSSKNTSSRAAAASALFGSSSDDSEGAEKPVQKATAPSTIAGPKKPFTIPKRSTLFDSSTEDD